MLTINGTEVILKNCINSIVRARTIDGSRKDVRIVQHEGNVVFFTDSKGNKYALPENVKLKVFTRIDKLQEDSNHLVELSLKHIWEHWGDESVVVEDYLGNHLKISIQGISQNEKYGWPAPHDFAFQEENLIINEIVPNDEKPELIENIAIDQAPLEQSTQVQAEDTTPSFDLDLTKEI